MATIERAYVNRKFIEDINKNQEIRLFKCLLSSSVDTRIENITEEIYESVKLLGTPLYPITYIENDVLIAKIKGLFGNDKINRYYTIFFLYAKEDDNFVNEDRLAFAVKIQGIGSNTNFQDYADNYISFDMKGFDLCCRFEPLNYHIDEERRIKRLNTQYSPKHEHISSPLYSIDEDTKKKKYTNNKLIDVIDLNKKIFDKLKDTLEIENPTDIEISSAEKLEILPDARVIDSSGEILNENGSDFVDYEENLNIVNNDKITKDDALIDA